MVRIVIKQGEDFKNALKRFRKACEKEGVIKDMKRCMYYESKGEKRRRAKLRSLKNITKEGNKESNNLY